MRADAAAAPEQQAATHPDAGDVRRHIDVHHQYLPGRHHRPAVPAQQDRLRLRGILVVVLKKRWQNLSGHVLSLRTRLTILDICCIYFSVSIVTVLKNISKLLFTF